MAAPLKLILEVLALCLFLIATTNFVTGENRVRIISGGLFFLVASMIF